MISWIKETYNVKIFLFIEALFLGWTTYLKKKTWPDIEKIILKKTCVSYWHIIILHLMVNIFCMTKTICLICSLVKWNQDSQTELLYPRGFVYLLDEKVGHKFKDNGESEKILR